MPFAAAVIVTIVCGAAVGFFNAFMVNKIHLEAFIATLVTQSIIRGFAYIICGEENRYPSAIRHSFFSEKQGS